MSKPDLTHAEARDALIAFRAEVSEKAYASMGLNHGYGGLIDASLYPQGLCHSDRTAIYVKADSYREALDKLRAQWLEAEGLAATNTIRAMALRIITLTAEFGECTDAALRADFTARDVLRHADAAAELASEFASNGPFTVVRLTGANDVAEAA